jgi:aryl-alcohol dehydrogenase-like predicted oxidoreductase
LTHAREHLFLEYRKLGNTGLDCSLIGFGTWQIGGGRWTGLNDDESISLILSSIKAGINIFDVAYVYGQYKNLYGEKYSRSLDLLGKALLQVRRDEVIICLKLGQLDEYSHKSNYSPRHMISQFKTALKVLNTDYIDICLVHAPSINDVSKENSITVLKTLQ